MLNVSDTCSLYLEVYSAINKNPIIRNYRTAGPHAGVNVLVNVSDTTHPGCVNLPHA